MPGYYRALTWAQAKTGPCLLWSDREDTFRPADCSMVTEHRGRLIARVRFGGAGIVQHIDDLALLRFPTEDTPSATTLG